MSRRLTPQDWAAWMASVDRRLRALARSNALRSASIPGAGRVSALAEDDTSVRLVIGQQDDGSYGITAQNAPPPPVPLPAVVTSWPGGLRVGWSGDFVDGAVAPLDFARVEVHASTVAGFTPSTATLFTTFESPQGGVAFLPLSAVLTYVVLVARNTSGAGSVPSAATSGTPA